MTRAIDTARKPGVCRTTLDIGFVLDSSGSLRREYHKEKRFLNLLAEKLGVGSQDTRAGVVTYSYFTDLRWVLSV